MENAFESSHERMERDEDEASWKAQALDHMLRSSREEALQAEDDQETVSTKRFIRRQIGLILEDLNHVSEFTNRIAVIEALTHILYLVRPVGNRPDSK